MSYRYFIFKTIQISMVLGMLITPLSQKFLVLASTKSESEEKLEIDYEKFNKYHNLGMAYGLRGELEKALENYSKAIAFNPKNAIVYLNRGNIYARQSKWDLTLADYNQAIELDPKISGRAYYNRGVIYGRRQQWDKAISDYTEAIALRANYYEAYFNRSVVYLEQKNWQSAIEDLKKVIEADFRQEQEQVYYNLGFAYMKLREWNEAIENYTQAIAINPNSGKAYSNRAMVYAQTGNRLKAIADLQKARQIFLEKGDTTNYQNVNKVLQQYQQPLS